MVAAEWTHPSVIALAGEQDPIDVITSRARSLVFKAVELGWEGPPFDPFRLAELEGIEVRPSDDLEDARTVAVTSKTIRIEFNPNRPKDRIRFSIAHELAHTLFPDVAKQERHRTNPPNPDDWQLEMLCNIAAAELLMPIGTFRELGNDFVGIDRLLHERNAYQVSTEAVLLRIARLSNSDTAAFAASRDASGMKIDYVVSTNWHPSIPRGLRLKETILTECTAIGYTAKGDEVWPSYRHKMHVECVGIPPYPGSFYPRVAGILTPTGSRQVFERTITHLRGDATEPRGQGNKIVMHVVNDRTPNWGAGFASVVAKKWPKVQDEFRAWVAGNRGNLQLGKIHFARADAEIMVASIVAQHGYGESPRPRIRYDALRRGFMHVAEVAVNDKASVHAPRLGAGQAGGNWDIVQELLEAEICNRNVPVSVYSLPNQAEAMLQAALPLQSQ